MYRFGFIFFLSANCNNGCRSSTKSELPVRHKRKLATILKPIEQQTKKAKILKASVKKDATQIIALLHGLDRLSYDFDTMKPILQQAFPDAKIIALTSVNKNPGKHSPTSQLPIAQQAALAYEEIKREIKTLSGSNKQLVLIGHSQGGLRAFALIKAFGDTLQNEERLTIGRLITIGTPWKGAPIADHLKNPAKVRKKVKKLKNILNTIEKDYANHLIKHVVKKDLNTAMCYLYRKFEDSKMLYKALGKEGAGDLRPQSDFIAYYIPSGLKHMKVPITAIAGVSRGFAEVFKWSTTPQALTQLNQTYAEIIGGDPLCEHDMLLPVGTQHAEGLAKKDFECIKVYGTCHGNKVGIPVQNGIPELSNKQVMQQVVQCIAKTFDKEPLA